MDMFDVHYFEYNSHNRYGCIHHFINYRDPVISPYGYVFDREAVLEYYLEQKKENARKLKEWEKQCKKEEEEAERVFIFLVISKLS